MKEAIDKIKGFYFIMVMIFVSIMALYLVSSPSDFGLNAKIWSFIWMADVCLMCLSLCAYVHRVSTGIIKMMTRYILLPFFGLLLVWSFMFYFEVLKVRFIWNAILLSPFPAGFLTIAFTRIKW